MDFLQPLISFLIVIGVLVFVHELGHFLAAIWTGMRADVFALGMGPRVLGWNKLQGFTFGKLPEDLELGDHTDYRLCAFPIGGYVKIIGMIDESFDTEFTDKKPEPYEFRSKGALAKTLVLSAGVLMNFLLAIVVFAGLTLSFGHEEMATTRIGWIDPASPLAKSGITAGDRILSIDGKSVATWGDMAEALAVASNTSDRTVLLQRDAGRMMVRVKGQELVRALTAEAGLGVYPDNMIVRIGEVVKGRPAEKAGLRSGDIPLAVDTMPIRSIVQFQQYIRSHASKSMVIHVDRDGTPRPITVNVSKDSTIGVQLETEYTGPKQAETFTITEALSSAVNQTGQTISMIGASVAHVVQGTVSVKESFGGPIRIAQLASRSSDMGIESFLRFMALISISLGVMNLLPLPGLDGGHLVFVGIEAIIRRELPTAFKIRVQQVGMALLLMLMAFVLYLDLTR
ncbi:MAG: RIP metalloprotease RseP [Candidatus Kapabacteria bacterium]|nr:RIP metalloprotease RseP [Candidatus Kapabacteria bacterium]